MNELNQNTQNIIKENFNSMDVLKAKNLLQEGKVNISFKKGAPDRFFVVSGIIQDDFTEEAKVTFKKNGEPAKLSTTISTVFSLSEKQLRISSFNIKKGSSSIETSGVFSGSIEQQKIDRTNLQLKSQLHLNELYQWFQQTLPEFQLKPIAGIVNIDLSIKKVGPAKPRIRWQGSG